MNQPALAIAADTGPWLRPVQYERKARPQATPTLKKAAVLSYGSRSLKGAISITVFDMAR